MNLLFTNKYFSLFKYYFDCLEQRLKFKSASIKKLPHLGYTSRIIIIRICQHVLPGI